MKQFLWICVCSISLAISGSLPITTWAKTHTSKVSRKAHKSKNKSSKKQAAEKNHPKPSATKILELSDRARGGLSQGLEWKISLNNTDDKQASSYEVKVKGNNVLALCTAPARQKGETFLFNDRNLWIYKPGLRKPVSLSPRQRLTGQAANGDIATTNYARDYQAQFQGEETIHGKKTFKLFLQAKEKNVTYDKINYWVTQDEYLGIKAEFLTLQGSIFKTATFEYSNYIKVGSKKAPFISKMAIQDAAMKDKQTIITYTQPEQKSFSDSIFNVNNLIK